MILVWGDLRLSYKEIVERLNRDIEVNEYIETPYTAPIILRRKYYKLLEIDIPDFKSRKELKSFCLKRIYAFDINTKDIKIKRVYLSIALTNRAYKNLIYLTERKGQSKIKIIEHLLKSYNNELKAREIAYYMGIFPKVKYTSVQLSSHLYIKTYDLRRYGLSISDIISFLLESYESYIKL